jgi:hypothetical protein
MKSNSVFLVFAASIIIAGILLSRLFANPPSKIADNIEKKTAEAIATTPVPAATPIEASSPPPSASASPSPVPTSTPTATATSQTSPPSSAALSPGVLADFTALKTNALDMIPTAAEIQKLSTEDVHFTPKVVIEAAGEIGRVAEMIAAHPELSSRGLQFYKECAEKESAVEAIRATCLSDFKILQTRTGLSAPPPKVPKRVALLAEKLSS